MTKDKLKQYVYLKKEVEQITFNMAELAVQYGECESEEQRRRIEKESAALVAKVKKCNELRVEIEDFINSIEDSLTRQVFYYRYLKNLKWVEVAFATGGYNTHEGVRKIADRYLASKGGAT